VLSNTSPSLAPGLALTFKLIVVNFFITLFSGRDGDCIYRTAAGMLPFDCFELTLLLTLQLK